MTSRWQPFPPRAVQLGPGLFRDRFELNRRYLLSLTNDNLLQNYYLEACIKKQFHGALRCTAHGDPGRGDDRHWGWESPTCEVRGHFLGHWLSAAARLYATTGEAEVLARLQAVIGELARCQAKNGGEWVFSIPEKYLRLAAAGQPTWAPQYVLHKTLMGLFDAYAWADSGDALDLLLRAAAWFHRWTRPFARDRMDDLLDVETGGMLEVWANLYAVTRRAAHADLLERYTRRRLFEPLLRGREALTNRHANTTIPEIHGAARAYEVTGDARWRRIVEAYWRCAVTDRGTFCTGGQTAGELWTPPFEFAARLGPTNQEHCTVYNMIRLADYLLRWTGESRYADYIERNLYNGILAQQHPATGMVSYFLPLEAGSRKLWGTPTNDFWCCHGTLVQAHTLHNALIYYRAGRDLAVGQYIPSSLAAAHAGTRVRLDLAFDPRTGGAGERARRPASWTVELRVRCDRPARFALQLRVPAWSAGPAGLRVNGKPLGRGGRPGGVCSVARVWKDDVVRLEIPKRLTACPLPDEPDTVAFLDGPAVLAGLCGEERTLYGDRRRPAALLTPHNERQWGDWLNGYRARGQARGLRFKPLYEVTEEPYTVYFPIEPRPRKRRA